MVNIPGRGLILWLLVLPALSLPPVLGDIAEDTHFNKPLPAESKTVCIGPHDMETLRRELVLANTFDHTGNSRSDVFYQLEFKPTIKHSIAEQEHRVESATIGSVGIVLDVARMMTQANQPSSVASQFAGAQPKPPRDNSRSYTTQRGDTLAEIVQERMIGDGFSLQQKMIAMVRANPEAFVGNNMNNLRANKVLRLPDRAEIQLISREDARAEVARQYAEWRELSTKRSVDPAPQLAEAAELQKQVSLMQELVESRQQEYEDLSSRNKELQEIIAQQDRLIKLQREKIAKLQQRRSEQAALKPPDLSEETSVSPEFTRPVKPTGSNEVQFPEKGEGMASRGDTPITTTDFFAIAFILLGLVFFIAGSIGLLRLPDVYSRLHALTKADNVGLGLLVIGLLLLASDGLIAVKLVLVWVLVLASSATSAHLIAQRARRREQQV